MGYNVKLVGSKIVDVTEFVKEEVVENDDSSTVVTNGLELTFNDDVSVQLLAKLVEVSKNV